ncbi:hypothetical protein HK099_005013 [Clydaea vesicula]|uniref:Uncharacterized protein n=1 Tax=Clydaea vesicula TaxID=447962 RepID=A0AAD5TZI0_9FUNG|nr:hypothetical protein HK099_005013 [Clydaea vesicula]
MKLFGRKLLHKEKLILALSTLLIWGSLIISIGILNTREGDKKNSSSAHGLIDVNQDNIPLIKDGIAIRMKLSQIDLLNFRYNLHVDLFPRGTFQDKSDPLNRTPENNLLPAANFKLIFGAQTKFFTVKNDMPAQELVFTITEGDTNSYPLDKYEDVFTVAAVDNTTATLAVTLWMRDRKVEPPTIAVTTGMLFALPAVRNVQPGIPGIGCTADVIGFFWNMIMVATGAALLLTNYILKYKAEKNKPLIIQNIEKIDNFKNSDSESGMYMAEPTKVDYDMADYTPAYNVIAEVANHISQQYSIPPELNKILQNSSTKVDSVNIEKEPKPATENQKGVKTTGDYYNQQQDLISSNEKINSNSYIANSSRSYITNRDTYISSEPGNFFQALNNRNGMNFSQLLGLSVITNSEKENSIIVSKTPNQEDELTGIQVPVIPIRKSSNTNYH